MSFQYVSKNSRQLGWSSRSRNRSSNDRRVGISSSGLSMELEFTVTLEQSQGRARFYRNLHESSARSETVKGNHHTRLSPLTMALAVLEMGLTVRIPSNHFNMP